MSRLAPRTGFICLFLDLEQRAAAAPERMQELEMGRTELRDNSFSALPQGPGSCWGRRQAQLCCVRGTWKQAASVLWGTPGCGVCPAVAQTPQGLSGAEVTCDSFRLGAVPGFMMERDRPQIRKRKPPSPFHSSRGAEGC